MATLGGIQITRDWSYKVNLAQCAPSARVISLNFKVTQPNRGVRLLLCGCGPIYPPIERPRCEARTSADAKTPHPDNERVSSRLFETPSGKPAARLVQLNSYGKGKSLRLNGTVKFFSQSRGFGFITPDNGGEDVFVHASALDRSGLQALNDGDKVSFEIEDDRRGRGEQAANIAQASQ
jgi:CspA family cold shock protein